MPNGKLEKFEELDEELSESLDKVFGAEQNAQQHASKELFGEDKIKTKTDLSSKQVSKIARAYYLFDICKMPEGVVLLDNFLRLRVSKDRLSRKEYVDSLRSQLEADIKKGVQDVRGQFK